MVKLQYNRKYWFSVHTVLLFMIEKNMGYLVSAV